ncbi:MAG: dockerin type I domain-containing protein, partial [Ignavibacteria bacterium]
ASGSLAYNFTPAANTAYGNNQIQVDISPARFAVYSGDVDQDGVVDATDASLVDNDALNFITGYVMTDVDGNNFVDASDASIVDNNALNFVALSRP